MATDFTTVFGGEIKVFAQPRQARRQYTGYPGAHGLTAMHLGSRGRPIVITGRLAAGGANYNTARSNLQTIINNIENYAWYYPDTYTFKGTTYRNVVLDGFSLVPDGEGKVFHWTSEGFAIADFVARLTQMI